jgi:hypothetical protein
VELGKPLVIDREPSEFDLALKWVGELLMLSESGSELLEAARLNSGKVFRGGPGWNTKPPCADESLQPLEKFFARRREKPVWESKDVGIEEHGRAFVVQVLLKRA